MQTLFLRLDAAAAEPDAAGSLDMSGMMDLFMLLLLVGLAAAMLYTVVKLRRTCMLFDSRLLYPGNCKPEDCLDPEGFMDFITPRMLLCAIALLLSAAVNALLLWVSAVQFPGSALVSLLLPLAVLVWYVIIGRRAAKEYWGDTE